MRRWSKPASSESRCRKNFNKQTRFNDADVVERGKPMSEAAWWEGVNQRMRAYQGADAANLPGAVYAVETPAEGRLIGAVGDGWGDDAICAIGSMSKPFVATALLMALEERD